MLQKAALNLCCLDQVAQEKIWRDFYRSLEHLVMFFCTIPDIQIAGNSYVIIDRIEVRQGSAMSRILKVSRLEGLTDGVFAIAMTILALDMHIPFGTVPPDQLHHLMTGIYFKLLIYGGSFIILGTLWVAMNFQMGLLERLNRPYLWCHVFYLMTICVVPFSSSLIAGFTSSRVSIMFYALNLLCASIMQLIICECAHYYHLNRDIYTPAVRRAVLQRIFVAPPFYLASLMMAYWDTSIAFLLLILPTLIYIVPGYVDRFDKEVDN